MLPFFWKKLYNKVLGVVMEKNYDLLIIGGGPGGLTAGVYAKRAGLNCAIIERGPLGGTLNITHEVSNYTGFSNITGPDLAEKMIAHAKSFDLPFIYEEVKSITLKGGKKIVKTFQNTYSAKAIIIGIGAQAKKLGVKNEKQYLGKGVSYCASCDGNFFKGKDVAIVGGGNSSLEDGSYLAGIVNKLYVVHRRDHFTGEKYLIDRLSNLKNVEKIFDSEVCAIGGENTLENITIKNLQTGKKQKLNVNALFVCIGRGPDTDVIDFDIEKDKMGYILTDQNMQTSVEGVYAIGDIRATPLRQIITACSDGAISATSALKYIQSH